MAGPRKKPQHEFDETGAPEQSLSDDAGLVEAVIKFASAESDFGECKDIIKTYRGAKATVVQMVKDRELSEGNYRVGEFVIEVKDRNGGGFEVPAWEGKTVSIGTGTARPSSNAAARED